MQRIQHYFSEDTTSLRGANISDSSLTGSGKLSRLLKCFKCPFGSSSESGANMSTSNISRGGHQVSFRPRRQTEKSSFSESIATNMKVSTPLAAVALRKISKLGSSKAPQPVVKTISSTSKLGSPISLVNSFNFGRDSEENGQSQHLLNPTKKRKFTSEDCINFQIAMEPMSSINSAQSSTHARGQTDQSSMQMTRDMCKSKSTSTLNIIS